MYSLLCTFVSQYSNEVDFISLSEAYTGQRGGQSQTGSPRAPLPPFRSATAPGFGVYINRTQLSLSDRSEYAGDTRRLLFFWQMTQL